MSINPDYGYTFRCDTDLDCTHEATVYEAPEPQVGFPGNLYCGDCGKDL